MKQDYKDLKLFLDSKVELFNQPEFIDKDPISIPHLFSKKEDIEIAGFLSATIAWGNRTMILRNAKRLMEMMNFAPFDFVLNFSANDLKPFEKFVHRTFNVVDLEYFLWSLKNIYQQHGGLEKVFEMESGIKDAIINFRNIFFELDYPLRTSKHIANPDKNSSAKRLNMFLRWMVRNDDKGVDFGIWKTIKPFQLYCPLDIHSGRMARQLGLLQRKQNDWKAVEELTSELRLFDPEDPVKYDYALFGMGVNNSF
jgi:uncharacterized protein (TIGR02757 family)